MYAMQSYANENTYINFIFGASNFTEMFSRIDGYNELTQSDKELIEELNKQRKEVEQQQTILEEAKATLVIQQEEQKTLKTKYTALLEEQNKSIASTQNTIYDYGEMTETLDAAIKKFNEEAYETPTPTPPPPKPDNGGNNNNSGGNNNNNNNNGEREQQRERIKNPAAQKGSPDRLISVQWKRSVTAGPLVLAAVVVSAVTPAVPPFPLPRLLLHQFVIDRVLDLAQARVIVFQQRRIGRSAVERFDARLLGRIRSIGIEYLQQSLFAADRRSGDQRTQAIPVLAARPGRNQPRIAFFIVLQQVSFQCIGTFRRETVVELSATLG